MGKLIGDMHKAGVLLAAEGCLPSSKGSRVRLDGGKFSVTDGPFPETKELIAGFALLQVKSKPEAIEWTKRFLDRRRRRRERGPAAARHAGGVIRPGPRSPGLHAAGERALIDGGGTIR